MSFSQWIRKVECKVERIIWYENRGAGINFYRFLYSNGDEIWDLYSTRPDVETMEAVAFYKFVDEKRYIIRIALDFGATILVAWTVKRVVQNKYF